MEMNNPFLQSLGIELVRWAKDEAAFHMPVQKLAQAFEGIEWSLSAASAPEKRGCCCAKAVDLPIAAVAHARS